MDGSSASTPISPATSRRCAARTTSSSRSSGEIPAGLAAPSTATAPTRSSSRAAHYHWFSGDGMIHGFFVEDGKVRYRNRYVRTPKWRAGARRRQGAVRRLRQSDDHRSVGDRARTAASPTPTSSGTPASCWRWRRATSRSSWIPVTLESRGYVEPIPRQGHRPPEDRSRDRRDGLVRLFGRRRCRSPATMSYGVTDADGQGGAPRRLRGALLEHGARLPGHPTATRSFPILPLTGSLQRAMSGGPAYRLGAGQGRAMSA